MPTSLLGDNPKAVVALDLLLGTQGWRRFAEQSVNGPNTKDREEVDRLLVANGQKSQAPIERSAKKCRKSMPSICRESTRPKIA